MQNLDYYALGGGALGGAAYCMLVEGTAVGDVMGMAMCAGIGALSSYAINYLGVNYSKGYLPSDTTGTTMQQVLYGAGYGFAGSAIVGMVRKAM